MEVTQEREKYEFQCLSKIFVDRYKSNFEQFIAFFNYCFLRFPIKSVEEFMLLEEIMLNGSNDAITIDKFTKYFTEPQIKSILDMAKGMIGSWSNGDERTILHGNVQAEVINTFVASFDKFLIEPQVESLINKAKDKVMNWVNEQRIKVNVRTVYDMLVQSKSDRLNIFHFVIKYVFREEWLYIFQYICDPNVFAPLNLELRDFYASIGIAAPSTETIAQNFNELRVKKYEVECLFRILNNSCHKNYCIYRLVAIANGCLTAPQIEFVIDVGIFKVKKDSWSSKKYKKELVLKELTHKSGVTDEDNINSKVCHLLLFGIFTIEELYFMFIKVYDMNKLTETNRYLRTSLQRKGIRVPTEEEIVQQFLAINVPQEGIDRQSDLAEPQEEVSASRESV
jgi:hypothetical protein